MCTEICPATQVLGDTAPPWKLKTLDLRPPTSTPSPCRSLSAAGGWRLAAGRWGGAGHILAASSSSTEFPTTYLYPLAGGVLLRTLEIPLGGGPETGRAAKTRTADPPCTLGREFESVKWE